MCSSSGAKTTLLNLISVYTHPVRPIYYTSKRLVFVFKLHMSLVKQFADKNFEIEFRVYIELDSEMSVILILCDISLSK